MPPIGIPFAAAALPAAAAAAIGVYGANQEEIHRIVNSFLGKKCRILHLSNLFIITLKKIDCLNAYIFEYFQLLAAISYVRKPQTRALKVIASVGKA